MTTTETQQEQFQERTEKAVAAPCALPFQPQVQETRDASRQWSRRAAREATVG
jgi:hypothetical protein